WLQDLATSRQQLRTVLARMRLAPPLAATSDQLMRIHYAAEEAEKALDEELRTCGPRADVLTSATFAWLMCAGQYLVEWLTALWNPALPPPDPAPASPGGEEQRKTLGYLAGTLAADAMPSIQAAEEFVAQLVVFILREILRHFRHFFAILSGGTLVLVLA